MKRTLMAAAAAASICAGLGAAPAIAQNQYLGEIRIMPYNFCPQGFERTHGQSQAISGNPALFSLLGDTFGGDGMTTFGLPDTRGRAMMGDGEGLGLTPRTQGQMVGVERVTLTLAEIPSHSHTVRASSQGSNDHSPAGDTFGTFPEDQNIFYSGATLDETMNSAMISSEGGGQSHENTQPSLVLNLCIATQGVYPPRN